MNEQDYHEHDDDEKTAAQKPQGEIAKPRQLSKIAGTYVPEKAFYRNDGLKHIKSVGYR